MEKEFEKKNEKVLKAINELKPTDKKEDFYQKLKDQKADDALTQEQADIIFAAYKKGVDEYAWKAYVAEEKYTKLAVKLADNMLKD